MRYAFVRSCAMMVAAATVLTPAFAEDTLYPQKNKWWKPVADEVYLQEFNESIATSAPVTSIASFGGSVYCVRDGSVFAINGQSMEAAVGLPGNVQRLESIDGALWAMTAAGLHRFDGKTWTLADSGEFVDLCIHNEVLYGATKDDLFRYEDGKFVSAKPETGYLSSDITVVMEDGTQNNPEPVRIGPILKIDSFAGTIYLLRPGQLILFDGSVVDERTLDSGEMPSPDLRDILAQGNQLYVATGGGLAVMRGMMLNVFNGDTGLPYEDTTCIREGFDQDLWIGTTRGAIRKVGDEFQYFGAEHWMPGDYVYDIAVNGKAVYAATDKGIGIIRYEPYTLAKKADYFEQAIEDLGLERLGFMHSISYHEDTQSWVRHISDNDGGHTAPYLAAMSFKYAVTGSENAHDKARNSFEAMIWMEEITGIPGFICRAIWSTTHDEDKKSTQGSGGLPAKWYPTDDGKWFWKGDTSSDESDAHFYGVSIFHDIAAKGPEKKRAAEHLSRMAMHIIDNGFLLRDKDGKPTRWGRWDPNYLLKPYGYEGRGLNGMEVQGFMLSAYRATGDERFNKAFQQLLDWNYHKYTVRQRVIFPPEAIAPWDDHLAFQSYYTLFRCTNEPMLRSIYLRSIERSWEIMRPEQVAWYNYVYGAVTGNDCDTENSANYLRMYPIDLRSLTYRNSHRSDARFLRAEWPYTAGKKLLSPRDTQAKSGTRQIYPLDGGNGGRSITNPASWLQDYWMGRYHGFIEAPRSRDAGATTFKGGTGLHGAKPFAGPGRPEGLIPK
jgi:hypothetical protein